VVIGGGPAGTTAAALLHEKGWHVVLLERDRHPRFHIGESLLPLNLPILKRLGVLEQVAAIGVRKNGAEFAPSGTGDRCRTVRFSGCPDNPYPYAYQVPRAAFDEALFGNCRAIGVDAREGMRVEDVRLPSRHRDGRPLVQARDAAGRTHLWTARFVVDASGRDTFLARRLAIKERNRRHNTAAVFGHFRGALRRQGDDAGNITIYWFRHGWFWMIPLPDDVMSVGAVCRPEYLKARRCDAAQFLWQTIALCPEVDARLQGAQMVGQSQATGNYSYASRNASGAGYLLVGDAFAFVDPVFSTGVLFAMRGAEAAAEAVDAHLRGAPDADRRLAAYERKVRHSLARISWFIHRFNTPVMRELFMAPRDVLGMRRAITSMLSGNVFGGRSFSLPIALFKLVYYVRSMRSADGAAGLPPQPHASGE
jgi:flavin-dependent dehydrogenase